MFYTRIVTIGWTAMVIAGAVCLWGYEKRPGNRSAITPDWSSNESVSLDPMRVTVLLFAHPRCPCTESTIQQFAELSNLDQASATVIFFVPEDAEANDADWQVTASVQRAREIPGIRVIFDRGGELSKQFRAQTSGVCLAFRPDGSAVFHGGITIGRGHLGTNEGVHGLTKAIAGSARYVEYPVYGCPIKNQ